FTPEPIIKLSARLCEKVGRNFNKCFYAENGSSAIEVALKMRFHYHLNKGVKKSKFLSLSNSYTGETLRALSVGEVALYTDRFQ
ncbi:aminotransferase class III-fold pyridoxal phosphate-dependent enzyme, partial [Campylobacter jejuni]|uniref:aminotransferase class III-fold pyridoxal phosphate-dependent enzyme n=1 Tax=Campylobacter jejuni TaxID=197 RepID=UPI00131A15A1